MHINKWFKFYHHSIDLSNSNGPFLSLWGSLISTENVCKNVFNLLRFNRALSAVSKPDAETSSGWLPDNLKVTVVVFHKFRGRTCGICGISLSSSLMSNLTQMRMNFVEQAYRLYVCPCVVCVWTVLSHVSIMRKVALEDLPVEQQISEILLLDTYCGFSHMCV